MRVAIVWIGLAATGLAGCSGNRHDGADAAATPAGVREAAPPGFLSFDLVAESSAPDVANLSATIEFDEQHTARLNAPVAGRVSELLVQVGDAVAADQPLIVLDSPEVKAAYAEHVRAEADLTLARRTVDRAGRLRIANAIAEKDYLQAQEDVEKATADFDRTIVSSISKLQPKAMPFRVLGHGKNPQLFRGQSACKPINPVRRIKTRRGIFFKGVSGDQPLVTLAFRHREDSLKKVPSVARNIIIHFVTPFRL